MIEAYRVIGGHWVGLDTRVGKTEKIYSFQKWRKVFVLPFKLVLPLPCLRELRS